MSTATHTVDLDNVGAVDVTIDEHGEGQAFLLPHGGGGPDTTSRFAELLAASQPARAINPPIPVSAAPPRREGLDTIGGLAGLFGALLDKLGLSDVTVLGNSIGGWIAAEIVLLRSPRVSGTIIIDGTGIEIPGHPIADFFSQTMNQVFERRLSGRPPLRGGAGP